MTDLIEPTLNRLRETFFTRRTRPAEWRIQQLKQLLKGLREMRDLLTAAVEKDLGKAHFVTELTDVNPCVWDVEYSIKHVAQFVKDVDCDTPLMLAPAKTRITYEPLGVALIYGSWNYPYVVNIKPLCAAITSGNCAVIKPSEMAPCSSAAIKNLVEKYLDKDCYAVIEGGPEVAMKISQYPWDLICFTGSTQKGKLVAEAAAKNLIPCILELGGKCPAVIDTSANIDFAAQKVAFARFNNSGQTCLATDYVLVHESVQKQFIDRLLFHTKGMYGDSPTGSPEMGKVIIDWHCDRLKNLIDTCKGTILCGGKVDRNLKYVEPTIILNPDPKAPVMQEEIFGPVLPIMSFEKIDQVIDFINKNDKPLAVYYFGAVLGFNSNKERLENETTSGAFVTNEVMLHMINHEFGFGGVGASGYGRYGGYEGFKQWSNPKSVMIKPPMAFFPYNTIRPPFTPNRISLLRKILNIEGSQTFVIRLIFALIMLITFAIFYCSYKIQILQGLSQGCQAAFN